MNTSRKLVIFFTLVLMIVALLFPPYGIDLGSNVHKQFVTFDTLFKSEIHNQDLTTNAIRWQLLAVIQAVIALAGAAIYTLLPAKKSRD